MNSNGKVHAACPICQAAYKVPAETVGHKAKCVRCGGQFRVKASDARETPPPPVTEDDILRWLNEAEESEAPTKRPRTITPEAPLIQRRSQDESKSESMAPPPDLPDARKQAGENPGVLHFRKTG